MGLHGGSIRGCQNYGRARYTCPACDTIFFNGSWSSRHNVSTSKVDGKTTMYCPRICGRCGKPSKIGTFECFHCGLLEASETNYNPYIPIEDVKNKIYTPRHYQQEIVNSC